MSFKHFFFPKKKNQGNRSTKFTVRTKTKLLYFKEECVEGKPCSFPLIFTMLNMVLLWVRLYPPNSYGEVFTLSTSESDLTWI